MPGQVLSMHNKSSINGIMGYVHGPLLLLENVQISSYVLQIGSIKLHAEQCNVNTVASYSSLFHICAEYSLQTIH